MTSDTASSSCSESCYDYTFVVRPSWLCSSVRSLIFAKEDYEHDNSNFKNDSNDNSDGVFDGLFADMDLEENQEIGTYYGDILTTSQALKLPNKSYLMRLGK